MGVPSKKVGNPHMATKGHPTSPPLLPPLITMSRHIDRVDWASLVLKASDPSVPSTEGFKIRLDAIARRVKAIIGGTAQEELPDAPTGLVGSSSSPLSASLVWDPTPTATGYRVYMGPQGEIPALLGLTALTTFDASPVPEGVSSFSVSAVNTAGEGPRSATVAVDVQGSGDPPAPPPDDITGFSIAADPSVSAGVELSWDAFTGSTVTARIERRTMIQPAYATVATGVSGLTYTDFTDLTVGTTYEYRMIPRNPQGFEGNPTPAQTVTINSNPDTEAPPVPTMIAADAFGSFAVPAQITCVCSQVFAPDLVGYQFGLSLADDPATAEWSETFSNNVATLDSHNGGGILGGMTYYVWARSVDATVPANVSAPSPQSNSELVQLTANLPNGSRPKKPSNVLVESPASGEAHVTWTVPETSTFTGFEVYRREGEGPFFMVEEVVRTTREHTSEGLDPAKLYTFYVVTLGLESSSDPSDEASIYPAGQDATGGGTGQGEGPYDGMTAFGPDYYVPETIDYLVDVRAFPAAGALSRAFSTLRTRTEFPEGHPQRVVLNPRTDEQATQVAILLPDGVETDNFVLSRNGIAGARVVNPNFLSTRHCEIHLVGSSAAGLGDAVLDAEAVRDRDPSVNFGFAYEPTEGQLEGLVLDLAMERGNTGIHLWNWSMRNATGRDAVRVGRSTQDVGTNTGMVSGQNEFYMHSCELVTLEGSEASQNGVVAYNTRVNMDGVYVDMPHASANAFALAATPYGDMLWQRVNVHRIGGSAGVLVGDGRLAGAFGNSSPGELRLKDWVSPDTWSGRYAQYAGAVVRHEGMHQKIVLEDCDIVYPRATGTTASSWPPNNPLGENISDTGITGSMPILSVAHKQTVVPMELMSNGYYVNGVSITGCRFFAEDARVAMVAVNAAPDISIEQSVIVGGASAQIDIASAGPGTTTGLFGSFYMFGNNASGGVAAFETEYSISGSVVPDVIVGRNDVNLGSSTEDQDWRNFAGPDWNPPQDPFMSGETVNAMDLFEAGFTRIAAKEVIVPAMQANREPRGWNSGGYDINEWRVDAGEPQGVYIRTTGNDDFFEVSADKLTITYSDVDNVTDNMFPYSQKIYYSQYANKGDNINTPLLGTSGTGDAPGEVRVVCPRNLYERPVGAKVIMDNVSAKDRTNLWLAGEGTPSPPLRILKWGGRHNAMPDLRVVNCDFGTIHEEHGHYGNSEGPLYLEGNTYRNTAGQGTQWVHRSETELGDLTGTGDQQTPENFQYDPLDPPYRTVKNCHFVDCGSYSIARGRSSSSLTFQDSGYPTLPSPRVLIEDCTFVSGLDTTEAAANEGSALASQDGSYRYDDGDSNYGYRTSGEIRVGIEGGYFRNKTHYSGVDMRTVADARDDDSAAIHKRLEMKNLYIHTMDNDKAIVNIDGCRTTIIEDCVIIQELRNTNVQQAGISFDSDMWKARVERATINAHLLGGQKLILRNCVGIIRDYRSGTLEERPLLITVYDEFDNTETIGIGDLRGVEREYSMFYADGVQRTAQQVGTPTYDGAVRPGYMPS